ncbi:MAG TPA: hypothetical protein EYQ50_22625 [Verrucomicrobiales bacterium]|nr:hypothetical protein [Verrucomicrobiales bacterium]HIL69644.1 hypothetical protein [Verrucomicrobiota bacterium]
MISKGKVQFFGRFWVLVGNRDFMGHLLRPGFLSGLLLLWVFVSSNPDTFSDEPPAEQNLELNSPLQQGNQGQRSMIRELRINFSRDISETLISSDLILMNLDQAARIPDAELNFEINREELQAVWSFDQLPGGSLGDGNYFAVLRIPEPSRSGSDPLQSVFGFEFFRYFGDVDGDRDVDFRDTFFLRKTSQKSLGDSGDFDLRFDSDNNETINEVDLALFEQNYLSRLPQRTGAYIGLLNDTGIDYRDGLTRDATLIVVLSHVDSGDFIEVRLKGQGEYRSISLGILESGSFLVTSAQLNEVLEGTLTEGSIGLEFRLENVSGDTAAEFSFDFNWDRTPPSLEVIEDLDSLQITPEGGFISLTVTGDPFSQIESLSDGVSITADAQGRAVFSDTALEFGENLLRFRVSDSAGNERIETLSIPLTNQPPEFISDPVTSIELTSTRSAAFVPLDTSNWQLETFDNMPFVNGVEVPAGEFSFGDGPDFVAIQETDGNRPVMLLSDFELKQDIFQARIQVNELGFSADDYIGLVFGFQNTGEFFLFDWKQRDQSIQFGVAETGMSIKKFKSEVPVSFDHLWPTLSDLPGVELLYHNNTPWRSTRSYRIELKIVEGAFQLTVSDRDGIVDSIVIEDPDFKEGKVGFYSYSQYETEFQGFLRDHLIPETYRYSYQTSDFEKQSIAVELLEAPPTMELQAGELRWSPGVDDAGAYTVSLQAMDDQGAVSLQTFDLTVSTLSETRTPVITTLETDEFLIQAIDIPESLPISFNHDDFNTLNFKGASSGKSEWVIQNDGQGVVQTMNFLASAFVMKARPGGSRIQGQLRNDEAKDDDYIGFIFGYQDLGNFYLFDWRAGNDAKEELGLARQGMSIRSFHSESPLTESDLWPTFESSLKATVLFRNDIPWIPHQDYHLDLIHQQGFISIQIRDSNGEIAHIEFQDKTYAPGQFGLYNFSQPNVVFSDFSVTQVVQPQVLKIDAFDEDGDLLSFSLFKPPTGMSIHPLTGEIKWKPLPSQVRSHVVIVVVDDGQGGTDTKGFIVKVI